MSEPLSTVRLDKWLWAVRLYKTRSAARDACTGGHVRLGGSRAKPSQKVKVGDEVVLRRKDFTATYRVERLIEKRVGAPIAAECLTDLTPDDERPKPQSRRERVDAMWAERTRGAGRPTKRDRRQMEKFLDHPRKPRR